MARHWSGFQWGIEPIHSWTVNKLLWRQDQWLGIRSPWSYVMGFSLKVHWWGCGAGTDDQWTILTKPYHRLLGLVVGMKCQLFHWESRLSTQFTAHTLCLKLLQPSVLLSLGTTTRQPCVTATMCWMASSTKQIKMSCFQMEKLSLIQHIIVKFHLDNRRDRIESFHEFYYLSRFVTEVFRNEI